MTRHNWPYQPVYTRSMALPPSAYRQWKESAPEVASIEVVDAATESSVSETQGTTVSLRRTEIRVDVQARVIAVERTATELKPEAMIRLKYVHKPLRQQMLQDGKWADTQMVGASPIPILEKGDKVTAWLRRVDGADFEPAAEAESFLVIPPAEPTKKD